MMHFINKFYRSKEDITFLEANKIMKSNIVTLLDVRSPQEYNEGHIINSVNIPVYELINRAKFELNDKERIIIAYCSAGKRSRRAVKILKALGYKNVYHIQEGIK